MKTKHFDLIFLGAGLASGTVARFLKRRHQNLKILILEKKMDTNHSPGESTVGVAGLFFIRDLGLSTYLYTNHLPKNGLRYFFKKSDQEVDFESASEIGSNILPIFPTFQIDRKRLDRDLWTMNQEIGIETLYGVSFADSDIQFAKNKDKHTVTFEHFGEKHTVTTDWLIQAQGRRSNTFEHLSPRIFDKDHILSGSWGRFKKVKDIDSFGSKEWSARVGYTSRYLSTTHFMGKGYWIWQIPINGLGSDLVSFGIVYVKDIVGKDLGTHNAMLQFFKEHKLVNQLLEDAEIVDFQAGSPLAHQATWFASKDKLALIGDSLMFMDPFYSPGSDNIARQAWYLEHLITANEQELANKVDTLNELIRTDYETLKILYLNQYACFGSYEAFNIKALWDFHSYTNRVLWNFYKEKYASFEFIQNEVKHQQKGHKAMRAIQNGFRDLVAYLYANNLAERQNLNHYSKRQNRFLIEEYMLSGLYTDNDSLNQHLDMCRLSIEEMLDLRFELNGGFNRQLLHEGLLFHQIEKFSLSEDWLKSYLLVVEANLKRQVVAEIKDLVSLTIADLKLALPKCFEGLSLEKQKEISELWQRKPKNLIRELMHGTRLI